MRRYHCVFIAIALVLTGCTRAEKVLGRADSFPHATVAAAQAALSGREVAVRGRLVEKCPVAGCWFVLRDDTGTIKVDTKASGFVVLDVPVQQEVLLSGIVRGEGPNRSIDAVGLRY